MISAKLKRAHSAEPIADSTPRKASSSTSPTKGDFSLDNVDPSLTPPPTRGFLSSNLMPSLPAESMVGSPLKKSRPSLPGEESEQLRGRLGMGLSPGIGDVLGRIEGEARAQNQGGGATPKAGDQDEDEEL
jgi:hypothetical protein